MTFNSSPSISSISTATISIQASIDSISTSSFNFMEKQVSTMQPRLEEVVKNPKKTKLKTSTKNSQYLRSSQSSVVINGTTSSSPSITNQKEKPTTSKTYYQKKKERLALEALQASLNNPSASVNNSITSSNSGTSIDNKTSLDELKLPYNNPKIYSNSKDETDSSDGSDDSDDEDGTSKKRRKIQRKWDQDRCDLGWRWNWLELQIHDLHNRLKDEDKKTLENKITSSSSSSSLSTSSSAHRNYKKQKTQSQPVTPTLQVPITRSSSTLSLSPNSQLLISDQPLPVQIPVNNNKKQKTVYKRKKVNHPLFKTPRTRKKSNKQSQSISHSNSSHSVEVMDEDVVNDDDEYEEYILSDSDEDTTYRDMKRSTRSSLTSSSGLISPRASRDATPRSLKRSSRSRDFDLDNVIIPNDGLSTPVTPRLIKEILTPVCKELKEDPFEELLFSRLNSGSGTTTPTNISRSPSLTKMVESTEISLKMEVDSQQLDGTVREIIEIPSSTISRSVSEIELSTPPNGLASAHESSDEDDTDDEKIEQRHLFRELLEKKRCLFLDLKPPSCPEKLPLEYFIVGDSKKKNKAVDPKKIQKLEEEIKEMRQNYYNCSKFPFMNWIQHGITVIEIETQRAQQREKERLERERYEREKIENRKLRMSQKKYISKKKSQTCQESPENAVEDVGRDYEMEQLDSSYHSSDEDFLLFQDLEDFFSEEEDEEEEQNVKESEFKPKKQYNTNKQKWKNLPGYTIIIDKIAPLDDQNRERNIIYLKKVIVPTTEDNSEKKESNSMEVDQNDKTEVTDTSSPVGSVNNEEISESTQINLSMDDRLLLEQECPTDADNNADGTTDVMTNSSSSSSDKSKKNLPAGVRVVMSDSMECLSNQLPNLDTNLSLSSSTSSNQGQPLSSPTVANINSKRDEVEEKTDVTNVDNGSNGSNDGSIMADVDNKKIEKTQTQTERAFNETLLEDSKIQSTVE